jgi:DNA-binding MarR family transcriptional regulator
MTPEKILSNVLYEWAEVFMRRSMRDFKRFIDESGLSPSQLSTLMHLYYSDDCGVSSLSDHLGITKPAVSQLIERLVKMGLLARTENPNDRRSKQLSITSEGEMLIRQGIDARRKWMETLTESLDPAQQLTIADALTTLTEAAKALNVENQKTGV